MTGRLRDLPLPRKLAVLVLATMSVAAVIAAVGLLLWDVVDSRQALADDLESQAAIVADNTAAALSFQDADAATETLRALRRKPGLVRACLYDTQALLFAAYRGPASEPCETLAPADGAARGPSAVSLTTPVMLDGRRLGTLNLQSSLAPAYERLQLQALSVFLILGVATVAALALASRLQEFLVAPLLALASTARTVTETNDYSLRASRHGNDEVGEVVAAFNRMLERIEAREAELSDALRLKDEFLATVSHELRTPLNAIVGWAHMLRTPDVSAETVARGAETIERNARWQAGIIDDILDVSRIITGKLRLEHRPFDLADIVESAVEVVQPAAHARKVALTCRVERPAVVVGDAQRLRQVVWNLVSNGVKFTPAGGTVEVRLQRDPDYHWLVVRDSGIGIDPAFLPFVFEPFRQGDASSTRRQGGLGLGLAIVSELVALSGGEVRAASDGLGRGATFTVRLPRARGVEVSAVEAGADGPAARLEGVTILVVEDHDDTREVLAAALRASGALVTTAASTPEARERLAEAVPDVVLTDLAMPGEDGYALLHHCRTHPSHALRRLPVVALTAYAGEQARRQALEAGFDAHLSKPLEPTELAQIVAAFSGQSGGRS